MQYNYYFGCAADILFSIGLANTEFVTPDVNELLVFVIFILAGLSLFFIFRQFRGIGNENTLQLKISRLLKQRKKQEAVILTMDIRQFHHLNIVLGIRNCNLLLEEICRYLYQLVGKSHVFQEGDTFSIIIDTPKKSKEVIQAIEKRFSEEWRVNDNHIVVDIVMVSQHWPGKFSTVADFFAMQEYMLAKAKKAETQVVVEMDEELLETFQRRKQVETAIENAISENNLQVYYQPIYSSKEKRIVSLEALIWIQDEELGVISQEEFVPIAEKSGSMISIGEIVLEESCKFLAKHVLANTSLGICSIQIHISVVQCMKQNLKEAILPILKKYHIPPSMITFEITESAAIGSSALMLHHMKELGELGISFALTDYRSSNSICSYMVKFPFKMVRIDKERIWTCLTDNAAKIILENEFKTMKMLDIPIVIEGIETAEERAGLEQLDVDFIQGSYYGKPMTEKECLRYIRNLNGTSEEFGRV